MTFLSVKSNQSRAFTLIELLVVISVIGVLSTVVLAALSSARKKGQDASVQSSIIQLRNVYELEYLKSNSYTALFPSIMGTGLGWSPVVGIHNNANYYCKVDDGTNSTHSNYCQISSPTGCVNLYNGGPGEAICKDIFNKVGALTFGIIDSTVSGIPTSDYALAAQYISDPSKYFCLRSSGNSIKLSGSDITCITKSAGW